MKFASPYRNAHVRRNRRPQRKRNALGEPRAQRGAVGLALLLERRPHREQRDGRERVGERVDGERERAGDPEERAAERRADEPDGRQPPDLGRRRRGQLAPRHDRAQGADLRRREHRGGRALDERDDGIAQKASASSAIAAARLPIASARTTSAATISRFRFHRSASEARGEREERQGRMRANATRPAFAAEPVSASTSSGYASIVACVPAWDSSCPVWSSRKSRLRPSGTVLTRRSARR